MAELRHDAAELKRWSRQEGLSDLERVRRARHTASILRILSLRASDPAILGEAKEHLRMAVALGPSLRPGDAKQSCEAMLSLIGIEAEDSGDLVRALSLAEAMPPGPCKKDAERLAGNLSAFSPSHETQKWLSGTVMKGNATLQKVAVYGLAENSNGKDAAARSVRVVALVDGPVKFERSERQATRETKRYVSFALHGTQPGAELRKIIAVKAAGLRGIRVSKREELTDIHFELGESARLTHYFLSDPFRLVVDITPSSSPIATDLRAVQTVVLDPGHGGRYDRGAKYEDLNEADLVLDLAFRVAADLARRMPTLRVLLTRQKDKRVTLEQRVAMANASGADLFVSIHLNSATEHVKHGGVTTFVLDTADDEQALKLAARENGTSIAEVKGLSKILANLHRQEQVRASRTLAQLLHHSTLSSGRRHLPRLSDRGVRKAMFYVLVGARMPAVLVEASFLTRRQEAEALRTDRYRDALAQGIADGIVRYSRGE